MIKLIKNIAMYLALCTVASGCAHTDNAYPDQEEAEKSHKTRSTLIAVGTAILVGALIANQAESNAKEAIRGAVNN